MVLKPEASHADPLHMDDRGDIVLGWLTKLVVVLGVLGVLGFDAISLGTSYFQAEDHANTAARAASDTHRAGSAPNVQAAYDAALAEVLEHGETIDPQSFTISPQGEVSLTLRRTAPTLVMEKVGPLRSFAEIERTVTAQPASS